MLAVAVTLRTVSAEILADNAGVISSLEVSAEILVVAVITRTVSAVMAACIAVSVSTTANILGTAALRLPVVIAAISGDAAALLPVVATITRGLIIAIHLTPFLPLSSSSPLQYP